jgi:hypothetical protein
LQNDGRPWQGASAMWTGRSGGAVLILVAWAGCATTGGALGFLGRDPEVTGVKMLVPHAVGRSCRTSVLGLPMTVGEPSLEEALNQILARDAEGDIVTSAVVRWHAVTTGVYNRRCVEVRGDLGRLISTLVLPLHHRHDGG